MNIGRDNHKTAKYVFPLLLASFAILAWWGCSSLYPEKHRSPLEPYISALPWPEADSLFRSDKCWLGGDCACSIDLGKQRVLWLFGDSFIDPAGSGQRNKAAVVRNSIAIQQGYDPTTAEVTFYWGDTEKGADAYFGCENDRWFWPVSGARACNALIVFLLKIHPAANELGFEPEGSAGVFVKNPESSPRQWDVALLRVPENDFGIIIGSAALCTDDYLYAFGTDAQGAAYLVRWPLLDAAKGDLSDMFFWSEGIWCEHDRADCKPSALFQGALMEYTVHYEAALSLFMQIQTGSFMDRRLTYRTAPDITGPWCESKPFYTPTEDGDKDLLVYAGKAHHCLKGSDLIFTYVVNSLDMDLLVSSNNLYYPVFVRGSFYRGQ